VEEVGLKVFRLTLDFEALNHQEFDDFYYIATADRTEEEFRQAVGEVAQAIHESNFTDRECWACLRNAMNDRGFVPIWDYETGVVTGSLKLPEPRGLDLTLDEEVKA